MNAPRSFELRENLQHTSPLHAHPGQRHDVGPGQPIVIERLNILVNDRDVMLGRRKSGQQRQAGRRQVGPLMQQGQGVFQPPVGDLEPRIYEHDLSHFAAPNSLAAPIHLLQPVEANAVRK